MQGLNQMSSITMMRQQWLDEQLRSKQHQVSMQKRIEKKHKTEEKDFDMSANTDNSHYSGLKIKTSVEDIDWDLCVFHYVCIKFNFNYESEYWNLIFFLT